METITSASTVHQLKYRRHNYQSIGVRENSLTPSEQSSLRSKYKSSTILVLSGFVSEVIDGFAEQRDAEQPAVLILKQQTEKKQSSGLVQQILMFACIHSHFYSKLQDYWHPSRPWEMTV